MKRLLLLTASVGACSAQPRSVEYFEAHPKDAVQVMRDCVRGAHRGPECKRAQAGKAAADAKARMELFRKGFE